MEKPSKKAGSPLRCWLKPTGVPSTKNKTLSRLRDSDPLQQVDLLLVKEEHQGHKRLTCLSASSIRRIWGPWSVRPGASVREEGRFLEPELPEPGKLAWAEGHLQESCELLWGRLVFPKQRPLFMSGFASVSHSNHAVSQLSSKDAWRHG